MIDRITTLTITLVAVLGIARAEQVKPNVILIMTDDQGYGDLSCHGNPVLKTPNMDRLRDQSIRFTDFHVSPLCTPTRAALMTGRYPARTGAYRTSAGRSLLHTDEITIADVFADNGYVTGMMGKWHLGDNAPHRPQDRGFQDVVWHRCGGIGQVSDYWGNNYYDDMYERNGKLERFEGYCTDIWFAESLRFVKENKDRPFFLYLSLNAPHSPYIVDEKWSEPYQDGDHGANSNFLGMIANIDYNLGVFREQLDSLGLAENTILIFMTDNGTAAGAKFDGFDSQAVKGFNADMRGKKCSIYEGGHRVPFFIRWPAGNMDKGRDITSLAAHIDVLPTLAELCGIELSDAHQPDGISFASLLKNPEAPAHRDHLVVQLHGGPDAKDYLKEWDHSCVIKDHWRLINGGELYDLSKDPSQMNDIAADSPEKVGQLRSLYPAFHEPLLPRMTAVSIDLGNPTENPTFLCSQDWHLPEGNPPWNFRMIKKLSPLNGPWMVDVKKAGRYRLTLRQWPAQANKPVDAFRARVQVAGLERESAVEPGSEGIIFELDLPAGKTELRTWLYRKDGKVGGAYFTEVKAL